MSVQAGDLWAQLSLDAKNFSDGMRQATNVSKQAAKDMEKAFGERPQKALKQTEKEAARVSWVMRGYIKDTARVITGILISQAFYALLRTIRETARAIWGLVQDMDQLRISFRYLMGDMSDYVGSLLHEIEEFAAKTPYTFMEAAQGVRQLLAAGYELERIIDVMVLLEDASAVAGVGIQDLVNIFAKIRAQGRVTFRELEQFGRMGIPAIEILAEQLGMTNKELIEMGVTTIEVDDAINALLTGFQERFGGAALDVSRTLRGLMSTIRDNVSLILVDLLQPMYDFLTESFLPRLLEFVAALREGIRDIGPAFLLERFIPPELHTSVRAIIASLQHLFVSLQYIAVAFARVGAVALQFGVSVLGPILPIIAGFVRMLAYLIHTAMQSSTAVRWLVGTIAGLAIVVPIAARVVWLAKAIGLLAIAQIAGKLILYLRNSIWALATVILKGGIPALLALLAVIVAVLTLSSAAVRDWVNGVIASLARLFNIDISGVLQPIETEPLEDLHGALDPIITDIEDLGEAGKGAGDAAEDIADDLEDVADKAKDAADEFKKFLAPFDEVYQVPEQDLDLGDLDDLPDLADLPDLEDIAKGIGDIADALQDLDIPFPEVPPMDISDVFVGFDDWLAEMEDAFENFRGFFDGWRKWLLAALLLLSPTVRRALRLLAAFVKIWIQKFFATRLGQWVLAGLRNFWAWLMGISWIAWIGRLFRLIGGWIKLKVTGLWAAITGLGWLTWIKNLFRLIGGWLKLKAGYAFGAGLWPAIKTALAWLGKVIVGAIAAIGGGWVVAIIAALALIGLAFWKWGEEIVDWFKDTFGPSVSKAWEWAGQQWEKVSGWVGERVVEPLQEKWEGVKDWFEQRVGRPLGELWEGVVDKWEAATQWIDDKIIQPIAAGWQWLSDTLGAIFGTIGDVAGPVWEDIKTVARGVWYFLSKYIPERWGEIWESFKQIWEDGIAAGFLWLKENVWDPLVTTWETIKTRLGDNWRDIRRVFSQVWENYIAPTFGWLKTNVWDPLVTTWEDIKDDLSGYWDDIKDKAREVWVNYMRPTFQWLENNLWRPMVSTWEWITERLSTLWGRIKDTAAEIWDGIRDTIRGAINGIIGFINRLIEAWNNLRFSVRTFTLPDIMGGDTIGGWSIGTRPISRIPSLGEGGIVTRDMLARVGERGQREAVLPLDATALRPFAEVIGEEIAARSGGPTESPLPPLYVGTLIADRQGLRELERKMKVIRLEESARGAQ